MRYEPEEFELLKDHVEDFMKKGPMGDIFTPFFYKPYPYNQTGNVLDTLRFADARKLLIDYLYRVSRAKSIEVTRQTEDLIGELWEYGYPDKNREPDFLKNLAWDICRMIKSVDYWEWEAMRLPGESETDVARRTYQEIKYPDRRHELMQFWIDYLERMQPKYELEIQIAKVLTELNHLSPEMQTSRMNELKVLWENKQFLDSQMYQGAIIYHILKKDTQEGTIYQGLAEYGQEKAVCFSLSTGEAAELNIGYAYTDKYLFGLLEEGYEIAAMTMDGHLDVWEELSRWGIGAIPHKEGTADYLAYCKEKNISAAALKASMGWEVLDLFKMAQRQDSAHKPHLEDRHSSR